MKFKLTSTEYSFETRNDNMPYVAILESLGFEFTTISARSYTCYEKVENDIFIEINTIDELLELRKLVGKELIINEDEIEIYDGYRE